MLAGVLLVPLLEVLLIAVLGRQVGPWWTIGALLALSVLGAWLVRREGSRTWSALREAVASGRPPAREPADAALVLLGGLLLLLPGFLTGVLGLLLVLPPTRPVTRRWLQSLIRSRVLGGLVGPPGTPWGGRAGPGPGFPGPGRSGGGDVIEGEVVDEQPPDDPDRRG